MGSCTQDDLLKMGGKWINLAITVCWHIWKERCNLVFQKLKPDPKQVANRAVLFADYMFRLLSKDTKIASSDPSIVPVITTDNHWVPPPENYSKLNFDASFKNDTTLAGCGLILRDFAGTWWGCRAAARTAVKDPEHAECLAFLEAVRWCDELQLDAVIIETDCKNIEQFINKSATTISWEYEDILLDVLAILNNISSWEVSFKRRIGNNAADELAKHSRRYNVSNTWYDKPPSFIENQLLLDNFNIQ